MNFINEALRTAVEKNRIPKDNTVCCEFFDPFLEIKKHYDAFFDLRGLFANGNYRRTDPIPHQIFTARYPLYEYTSSNWYYGTRYSAKLHDIYGNNCEVSFFDLEHTGQSHVELEFKATFKSSDLPMTDFYETSFVKSLTEKKVTHLHVNLGNLAYNIEHATSINDRKRMCQNPKADKSRNIYDVLSDALSVQPKRRILAINVAKSLSLPLPVRCDITIESDTFVFEANVHERLSTTPEDEKKLLRLDIRT